MNGLSANPRIVIYTIEPCAPCARAKAFLDAKGFEYEEVPISPDGDWRGELERHVPGARTFPQVVINGDVVGGYEALRAYHEDGHLVHGSEEFIC